MGEYPEIARGRRWRWRLAIPAGVLLFAALGWLLYHLFSSDSLIQAAAETDRFDPGWRWDELLAKRPAIPDADNAFVQLLQVHDLLGKHGAWATRLDKIGTTQRAKKGHVFFAVQPETPANVRLPADYLTALRADLDPMGETRVAARKLAEFSRGRLPARQPKDVPEASAPWRMALWHVQGLLEYDAVACMEEGDLVTAAESIRAALRSTNSLAGEPYSQALTLCHSLQPTNAALVERLLAQGELDDARLRELQDVLADALATKDLCLSGLRGERAWQYGLGEELLHLTGQKLSGPLNAMNKTLHLQHRAEVLTIMNQLIEATKSSREAQTEAFQKLQDDFKERQPAEPGLGQQPYLAYATPMLLMHWDKERQARAFLGCALVAIAAERYRLKYGSWPYVTRDLTTLLKELPTDPYDGLPIQVKQVEDGLLVYSVALDGIDNGGNIQPTQARKGEADLGIKLWNPEKRRLPAGPSIAESEKKDKD